MELTDKNYEKIIKQNNKPVFIDFYSPSCGPCQMLMEVIDNGLTAYGEENGVDVVKCDVSRNPKLAEAFKVQIRTIHHCGLTRWQTQIPRNGTERQYLLFWYN